MALSHARPGQTIDLSPLGDTLPRPASHALLKTHALELIRLVLHAGQELAPHKVYGDATLHCLEGSVRVESAGGFTELHRAQLLLVPALAEYSLQALEDSSLLFTVQTPPGQPGSGSSTTGD